MKKIIAIALLGLLFLSGITIAWAATESTEKGTNLSVEDAINLALQHNTDYLKAKLDYEATALELEQTRYEARKTDEDEITTLQGALAKYVSPKQKELAQAIGKQQLEIAKEKARILTEESYYTVLKAQKVIEVQQKALERAEEQYKLTQKKYQTNAIAKNELVKAELNLESAQNDLLNAERDLHNSQIALNQVIGVDIKQKYALTSTLDYKSMEMPSIEDFTKEVLEKRLDLQQAQNAATIAEENYKLAISYEAAHTFTARAYKITLDKAIQDLKAVEQSVQGEAVAALYQLHKTNEAALLAYKNIEQVKESYNVAKKRYEIGVGTVTDVLNASIDLANVEKNYVESVYNYTIAKYQLNTVKYTR